MNGRPSLVSKECLAISLILVFSVLLIFFILKEEREKFVSRRAKEIYKSVEPVFSANAEASFTEVKKTVGNIDAAEYTDVLGLWRNGGLSPANIQKIL